MLMSSKIIKKLLDYAKQHEITDLSITQKNGNHILWGETGSIKHQLRLPAKLESELSSAYRRLLSLAPTDLVSGVYFKDKDSAFKISIIPDENGEKIIINTVAKTHKVMPLSHLGLGRNERKIIESFIRRRRGLIVVGSDDNQGKTTTIYSLLQKIDKNKRSCYLLEKHTELELDDINRIVSSGEKRLTDLNRVLKSDSEVIVVDDTDSALLEESLAAASDGRLVIAGVKTDSAASLVEKVRKISKKEGLPILLIYQKLLMKNCPHCLKAYLLNESEELIARYWPNEKRYKPKYFFSSTGCHKCNHSGVSGQIASFNLIEMNNKEINVLSSLASDVLQKAANGLISMSKYITEHKTDQSKKL